MVLGTLLHPGKEGYLLLGVPLTALFQIAIRRQPLRALWVRDAPPFRLTKVAWGVALVLAALPALSALADLGAGKWISAAFDGIIAVGAFPAVYCLWNLTRSDWRQLAACLLLTFALDVVFRTVLWMLHLEGLPHPLNAKSLLILAVEIPVFVPTMFVMEEVAFRGLLDSHLHPNPVEQGPGWLSAAYVSALWGIWHLPLVLTHGKSWLGLVVLLLAAHIPFGIVLSVFWRRTGNLLVPGAAHTLLDAVRDAFFL
jgi:membrane protease YdiL (CAAX protease family)